MAVRRKLILEIAGLKQDGKVLLGYTMPGAGIRVR